jgi:hypothetical protein
MAHIPHGLIVAKHLAFVAAHAQVPIDGSGHNHRRYEEHVIDGVENVGRATASDCHDCGPDRRIPPGGQGRITLTIAPYSVLRQFTKKTKVFFNDPDHPQVVLTLQGYGKPFIEIQPSHIIRFRGKPGEELRDQVRFISHLPVPWEIKEFKTNIPQFIDVNVKAEEPGRIYVVEVRNKRQEAGNYAGVIELFTTSEKRPRLIMRVFGELALPSSQGQ